MKYKEGDKFSKDYVMSDDDGNEIASFTLSGDVIYADEDVFIVKDDGKSDAETVSLGTGISLDCCKKHFPSFSFNSEAKEKKGLFFEYFVPLDQETEDFLIFDSKFI